MSHRRRQKPVSEPRQRDWEVGIRRLHAETAGLARMVLVTQRKLDAITADALAGGAQAALVLTALANFRRQIEDLHGDDAQLCLTCDRQLRKAACALFVLVIPARPDPTTCLALGVCDRCCAGYVDERAAERVVQDISRERLWPELRALAAPSAPGRA